MKKLRTGVIGLGRMGQHHCRIYANLRQTQFAGVYDINRSAADEISQRYDVPIFESPYELLEQVDAVSIATPTPTHFDLVMKCLQHGVHVLVEKPITESLSEAEELVEAIQGSDRIVQVGFIERFNPTYQELKNVLEGLSVLAINFRRLSPYRGSNLDVDVVLDLMIHDLDLMLDVVCGNITSLSAGGLAPFGRALDHVVAQFWWDCEQLVTLTASRVTEQKIRSIEVTTREAYLEADLLNKKISVFRGSQGEYLNHNKGGVKYRQENIIEQILVPSVEPLLAEIQSFVQCVVSQTNPLASVESGVKALRLAYSIREMVQRQNASQIELQLGT
jgi:predicted dehydrogenase